LWFRGKLNKVSIYNPFTYEVTPLDDDMDINQVAFKKGKVYGLRNLNFGVNGIFILNKNKKWEIIIIEEFTSFETLAKSDQYEFIALKKNS